MALMAERKALLDSIFIGVMNTSRAPQTAPALRILPLQQMPLAGSRAQHFAAGRNLETLRSGFLRFDTLWTTHKIESVSSKKDAQYRGPTPLRQGLFSKNGDVLCGGSISATLIAKAAALSGQQSEVCGINIPIITG